MREISTDMTIAEIIEIAPDSVVLFKNAGLACTGCNADTSRTLASYTMNLHPDEVGKLMQHLNKLPRSKGENNQPQPEDFEIRSITEGNKKYYRIAGLMLTDNAYKNLHQLAEKPGLRIHLATGGCSGYKYEFDYMDAAQPTEKEYKISDKLSLFMDDFTFARSYDSVVDFTISLHSSGLQIINPNQKRSCSCGVSFSL